MINSNNDDLQDCLFCLNAYPNTTQYDAPCKCKPFLHQRCLNKWLQINPNECPICRTNYETIGEVEQHSIITETEEPVNRKPLIAIFIGFLWLMAVIIHHIQL